MIAAQIGAALKARLSALTFSPTIPVAWPNRDFTPSGEKYLTAKIITAPVQRLTVSGEHAFTGSLVVVVCTKVNKGSGEADGIADAVAAWFPADLAMTLSGGAKLRITAAPSVRDGYQDAGYWLTPVTIPFRVMV